MAAQAAVPLVVVPPTEPASAVACVVVKLGSNRDFHYGSRRWRARSGTIGGAQSQADSLAAAATSSTVAKKSKSGTSCSVQFIMVKLVMRAGREVQCPMYNIYCV